VDNQSTLKEKSKFYYSNGWRLLQETQVAGMRLDAISQDDAGELGESGRVENRRTQKRHKNNDPGCG
jgi:hypothetical protein